MTVAITRPALRYHGGKFRLASWVIKHLPPHGCYVEPFGGAASVLLQKPRAYAEVYNDLDDDVVNFFSVLRDPESRARVIEACRLTPYARSEFELAYEVATDPIERARRTAVRAGMGFGSAGATKGQSGFRIDTRRLYGTAMSNWLDYPDGLPPIGERLQGVLIECRPAIEVMTQHDADDVLHYVDPPYLPETRVRHRAGGGRYYRHELTAEQHTELLDVLQGLRGMVVLSGYPSDLYTTHLVGWTMYTTRARIAANRGTGIRTEALWLNPAASAALAGAHGGLFSAHA